MKSTARNLHQERNPCLYNHDILSCTHEEVTGNHLYSGRALGLTEPEDIIQISPFLKNQWDAITAHYSRIELGYSQHVVWDISLERMKLYPKLSDSFSFLVPARTIHGRIAVGSKSWSISTTRTILWRLGRHLGLDIPKNAMFQW